MALKVLKTGDFDTEYFNKPSFFIYLHTGIYAVAYGVGSIVGMTPDIASVEAPKRLTLGTGYAPTPSVILLGESFAALLGVATALVLFFCARRLWGGRWTALLAVSLFAVSRGNIVFNEIHPDAHVIFFLVLSLFFAIGIVENGRTRDYLLTGITIGLAASCKYNGFLFVPSVLIVHWISNRRSTIRDWLLDRRLWLGLSSIFVTFSLLNPYLILHSYRFVQMVYWESRNYVIGQNETLTVGSSNLWYVKALLTEESPAYLLAILVVPFGLIPRTPKPGLLLSYPLTYLIAILFLETKNMKLLALLVPFLALLVGWLVHEVFLRLRDAQPRKRAMGLAALTAVLIVAILVPARASIATSRARRTEPSWSEAARWIAANLPEDSRIAYEPYSPWMDGNQFDLVRTRRILDRSPSEFREMGIEYLAFSNRYFNFNRYRELRSVREPNAKAIRDELVLLKSFEDGGEQHFVYAVQSVQSASP